MLKEIKDLNICEKTVLVRVDYNVPMENGTITDLSRITQSLETITYLLQNNAKVILLAHVGRPNGLKDEKYSLKPISEKMSEILPSTKVHFAGDCVGSLVEVAINCMKPGEIILLENLRFHKEEESCDIAFAKQLASLGDVFINDAFSVSHRKHTSVYVLPQLLPSAAGFALQKEINSIDSFLLNAEHPKTCIIGGAKVSTKLPLIKRLVNSVDHIILGGGVAVSFASIARRMNAIDPFNSTNYAEEIKSLCNNEKIYIPRDFRGLEDNEVLTFDEYTCTKNTLVLDIGPTSQSDINEIIKHSKSVLWNGPVGRFEDPRFEEGTKAIAKSIAMNTASDVIKSIIGGGDTIAAINKFGQKNCASYTSTAGGAFLEYLEGKSLPGIDVLTINV